MTQQKNHISIANIRSWMPVVWGVVASVAVMGTIYGKLNETVANNAMGITELKTNTKILTAIREDQAAARVERAGMSQDIKRIFNRLDSAPLSTGTPHTRAVTFSYGDL